MPPEAAVALALLARYGEETLPVILVYMLMGAAVAIPYGLWSRRRAIAVP